MRNPNETSSINDRRLVFDPSAVGRLRQKLIEKLGSDMTREISLQFGYEHGYDDCLHMKKEYKFQHNNVQLMQTGPKIHSWQGLVKAIPGEFCYDEKKHELRYTGEWKNSFEAEQHLLNNPVSTEPVCWMLMGYASGYASAAMGCLVIAVETKCVGKGDDSCKWMIKLEHEWDSETVQPYKEAYLKLKSAN